MVTKLSAEDRLRLMKFVCSFVWADLEVRKEERSFVRKLAKKLGFHDDEWKQISGWLEVPPRPEEVDPALVPKAHRKLFLDTVREVIAADHDISPDEREMLSLFEQLLR